MPDSLIFSIETCVASPDRRLRKLVVTIVGSVGRIVSDCTIPSRIRHIYGKISVELAPISNSSLTTEGMLERATGISRFSDYFSCRDVVTLGASIVMCHTRECCPFFDQCYLPFR